MSEIIKRTGDYLMGVFNYNIRRNLNNRKVIVPVRGGIKVGIGAEKWMSELLKRLFKEYDGTFLDIGANLGQTLIKVKTVDPLRNYIGLDPNPSCIYYLQVLRAVNKWQKVLLLPAAVYPVDSLLKLTGRYDTDGSSTVIDEYKPSPLKSNIISKLVPAFSFSTIQKALQDKSISFVKIDVEGAELEVMESLVEMINELRPIIIIEVWQTKDDPIKTTRADKLSDLLSKIEYSSFSWRETKEKPHFADFKEYQIGDSNLNNFVLLPRERREEVEKVLKHSGS